MRVLHIDRGAEMRGGQYQVLLLIDALRGAGHESLLLARPGGPLIKAARTAGIEVDGAEWNKIRRYSRHSDIAHAHDAGAHTLAALVCRQRFVVSRRVAFPVKRSWASKWKYRRAARFLAVSKCVGRELEASGIPTGKIDIVYDAVADGPRAAVWSPAHPAVALSSMDPAKGRDLVERASALAGIPVVYSTNLPKDLQQAAMFVYATRSEGLGSAALLAMSMGVPVVASRTGGLVEIISDGIDGLLFENDAAAIAEAMRRVRFEPGFGQSLVERGKSRILEAFTVQHLLENTLASYRRALAD